MVFALIFISDETVMPQLAPAAPLLLVGPDAIVFCSITVLWPLALEEMPALRIAASLVIFEFVISAFASVAATRFSKRTPID